jgi:hypothetical protein
MNKSLLIVILILTFNFILCYASIVDLEITPENRGLLVNLKSHHKKKHGIRRILSEAVRFLEKSVKKIINEEIEHLVRQVPKFIESLDLKIKGPSQEDIYLQEQIEFVNNLQKIIKEQLAVNVETQNTYMNKLFDLSDEDEKHNFILYICSNDDIFEDFLYEFFDLLATLLPEDLKIEFGKLLDFDDKIEVVVETVIDGE